MYFTDQRKLEDQLTDINEYFKKELRRAELKQTSNSNDRSGNDGRLSPSSQDNADTQKAKELIKAMQLTTRDSIEQFERCRDIIEKLHRDCDEVAHKNAGMKAKLRDSDQLLRMALISAGIKAFDVTDISNGDKQQDGSAGESFFITDMAKTVQSSARQKRNDAELIEANFQKNVELLKENLRCRQEDETLCTSVMDSITADLRIRKAALSKMCDNPPSLSRQGDNKYLKAKLAALKPSDDKRLLSRNTALRRRLEDLANIVQIYMELELLTVQKLSNNLKESEDDKNAAKQADLANLEREEWLAKVTSLENSVRTRRMKLQQEGVDTSTANEKAARRTQKRKSRKARDARFTESAFTQKLAGLEEEITYFLDIEQDMAQRHRTEASQLRTELETDLRLRGQQVRELERKLREVEKDRDKYKRLYEKKAAEKAASSFVFTRPTIPKRSPRKETAPAVQPPSFPVLDSPSRDYRQPRLTSRARKLTHLKEDLPELERKTVFVKPMPQQPLESNSMNSMTTSTYKLHNNDYSTVQTVSASV